MNKPPDGAMTNQELELIADLCQEASPGEWLHGKSADGNHNVYAITGGNERDVTDPRGYMQARDAAFIAVARQAVPALLAQIHRHRAEINKFHRVYENHDLCYMEASGDLKQWKPPYPGDPEP